MDSNKKIGVIDSGIGGLTVAKEILTALPNEDIVYLGDSKNCPYGNRSEEEIVELSLNMIRFMQTKQVKCVVIACNTISTLIEKLRPHFDFPIISIVECAANTIIKNNLSKVGLIATNHTVNSGSYDKLIKNGLPECEVYGIGSANLANLVDMGNVDGQEVENEITYCIDKLFEKGRPSDIILGCTHYPIVYNSFKKCYPDINFINPATAQCDEVKRILTQNNALNPSGGNFELYSTGDTENYIKTLKLLGAKLPDNVSKIDI